MRVKALLVGVAAAKNPEGRGGRVAESSTEPTVRAREYIEVLEPLTRPPERRSVSAVQHRCSMLQDITNPHITQPAIQTDRREPRKGESSL